jgi:iron complex transport system ATP-binding protein
MSSAITIKNLSFAYENHLVIDNLNLEIKSGDFIGIVGPNGCGKTTLLKTICSSLKPQKGQVLLNGKVASQLSAKEVARKLAIVPQEINSNFPFTVWEMISMGRQPHISRLSSLTKRDIEAIKWASIKAGVVDLENRFFPYLSGGEKQKVIIAQALAQEAGILLLDEPTSHLDINHQLEVMSLVARLNKEKGKTVVAVLHDLNLAANFCHKLVLLSGGKIIAYGYPETVLSRENLRKLFSTEIIVDRHPVTGKLNITYLTLNRNDNHLLKNTKVHLICGSGTGRPYASYLHEHGYFISMGVVNVLDSDEAFARQLNLTTVTEAPFSSITDKSASKARQLIDKADAIVITDVPFGPGNVKNLSLVFDSIKQHRRPVFLVDCQRKPRDFIGGLANSILGKLQMEGAEIVNSPVDLIKKLEVCFNPAKL